MILDEIAYFAYRQLPKDLQLVTIGVGTTETDQPLLAVYGKTLEIIRHACHFLSDRGWNTLDAIYELTTDNHVERQLARFGSQYIGLSHAAGVCLNCHDYFDRNPGTTITAHEVVSFPLSHAGTVHWAYEPTAEQFEHDYAGDDPVFASNNVYPLLYGTAVELTPNRSYDLQKQSPYMTYRFLRLLRDLFHGSYDGLKNSEMFRQRCCNDAIFQERFANGLDSVTKSRAFDAIMKLKHADQVAFLIDCLSQCSTDWCAVSCRELAKFDDARAIAALNTVLYQDADPDLRYIAAQSLVINGNATALAALEYAVKHDTGTDYEGRPIVDVAEPAMKVIHTRMAKR